MLASIYYKKVLVVVFLNVANLKMQLQIVEVTHIYIYIHTHTCG